MPNRPSRSCSGRGGGGYNVWGRQSSPCVALLQFIDAWDAGLRGTGAGYRALVPRIGRSLRLPCCPRGPLLYEPLLPAVLRVGTRPGSASLRLLEYCPSAVPHPAAVGPWDLQCLLAWSSRVPLLTPMNCSFFYFSLWLVHRKHWYWIGKHTREV